MQKVLDEELELSDAQVYEPYMRARLGSRGTKMTCRRFWTRSAATSWIMTRTAMAHSTLGQMAPPKSG